MTELRDQLQLSLGHAYNLERELGGGGMSRVFIAQETALGRSVVVKVLAPDLAAGLSAERFQREIKLAAALQHPNIVPLLTAGASGATGDLPYYTMPFVDGLSLRARLARGTAMPIAEIISILKDVARALGYAHERGVVHRDIKPENVLLSGDAAVVTDFGIAKALQSSRTEAPGGTLTQVGTSLGTPAYMAPEQAAGDPETDHRADIYGLGCMAYEMLTGRPLFANKLPHQLFLAHASEKPAAIEPQRPDCPKALATLVMRCLEKPPGLRPQSAREIQQQLEGVSTPTGAMSFTMPPQRTVMLTGALALLLFVAIAVAVAAARSRRAETSPERSIAVLPFESAGGDTSNTYFAEGVAEELITAFSKVPGLRVAGRSSSFRYNSKTADTKDIGATLNVASVLEGSVRRAGDRMRVTATLMNAKDGVVLWSESYERDIKNAFAMQDDITNAIVAALQVRLASGPTAPAVVTREVNPEAYDLYLRGLGLLRRRGRYVQPSIGFFEQAIAKDSTFGRAYAQLAIAFALLPVYTPVTPGDLYARALAAATRAVRLDDRSGEAHTALGAVHLFLGVDLGKAVVEFDRAIALDPSYAQARLFAPTALGNVGEYSRAVTEAQQAIALDPLAPAGAYVMTTVLLATRRFEDAAVSARRIAQLDSLFPLALTSIAITEYYLGHSDSARALALRASWVPPSTAPSRAFVLAATGDRAARAGLLRELEAGQAAGSLRETTLTAAFLGMGDTARALDALERAVKRREPVFVAGGFGTPMFDAIRGSPRFAAAILAYGGNPATVNSVMKSPPR